MLKSYLLPHTALRAPDDEKGAADPEAARKAAVAEERAKVQVTKVTIEEPEKDAEVEQEDEGGEEEKTEDGDKEEESEADGDSNKVEEDDKEAERERKKQERMKQKLDKKDADNKALKKRIADLEAKVAANPDKVLTEDDVELRAEKKANDTREREKLREKGDKLADEAQKHLKMKDKEFNKLIADTLSALEDADYKGFPAEVVDALSDIDNGGVALAHLLKNPDELEECIGLIQRGKTIKLGVDLAKLANKLASPRRQISKVPDAIETLGGKATVADRLSFLTNKKNKTPDEMQEYVQARNADIEQKRKSGRHNLR